MNSLNIVLLAYVAFLSTIAECENEFCNIDEDCYSGLCLENKCSKESALIGNVGGGGRCVFDAHCYSGLCYMNACAKDSDKLGKIGSDGFCSYNDHCQSGLCILKENAEHKTCA